MATFSFLPHLPHSPGVYLMRDNKGNILYIGKAKDLKKRVASYFLDTQQNKWERGGKLLALVPLIRHVDYVATASEREALVLEQKLIRRYLPMFNSMWRDDKSYPYLALTVKEDFPRLIFTRKKKNDGALYYGPYPSVKSVRDLMKWAWRKKIVPLRPCDIDMKREDRLPTYKEVRSCLHLHTRACPAPCVGRISLKDYKKMVDRVKWFLEGRHDKMIAQWEKVMKRLSRRQEFEEAAKVRDRIDALKHMQEPVTFREMTEPMLETRLQASRAVQDLMKALHLPHPPERIEAFDISHVQGLEKVASLVSFYRGRPDKSQYRKFIIRTVGGIDDVKSMEEVIRRRTQRLLKEGKPLPDLILVDGGRGQLSAALKALDLKDLKKIPVAALAKEEEEIFLPDHSHSIQLPPDSPALLLLRHVRDEAHRFAVTFHRKRRSKLAFMKVIEKNITGRTP
ncbi:MAG: excinuclease ABC subunit UvrC [Elusimicrobia bacterium]|nr:excinuclease ABC subunit UvrC [Candidatus Obscuribacterium magneticum]